MEFEFKTTVNFHNDEIHVIISCYYTPGCPEQGPTYSCGGQPAEPAEVSDLQVIFERMVKDNGTARIVEEDITFLFNNSDIEEFEEQAKVEAEE